MKISYAWLKEFVDFPWQARELGERLTLAGFELESLEAAAPAFSNVVVAEILSAERHPQADKLQVCRVSVGSGAPLQIVCGAANARAGLKSALAQIGAQLPGDLTIKSTKVRGVESNGMLASAKELGLAESSSGILELPAEAPVGKPLREYLQLDDPVLDIAVTPNRGDAMSLLGIAREVAALAGSSATVPPVIPEAGITQRAERSSRAVSGSESGELSFMFTGEFEVIATPQGIEMPPPPSAVAEPARNVEVYLDAPAACPTFAGCALSQVNNRAVSPVWLRERLRRAGVRSISPVVDVTNYVMLELGQPMHAYDRSKLRGDIHVRTAHPGERITLLDGRTVEAQEDVLLITDAGGPIGLAGIMGGERTAVSSETVEIFFEAAFFSPAAIIGRGRRWGLVTDAGQRFERGVDPSQQRRAVERAVALLQAIAGGQAGPVRLAQSAAHQPIRKPVTLRRSQLRRLLGLNPADEQVASVLSALQMKVVAGVQGWEVSPPPHRFDISIEADLIEEVARVVGYDTIPETDASVPQAFRAAPEETAPEQVLLEALAMRGYQEAITFAFVDPVLQGKLFADRASLPLANAIASDLSVMRLSLWPGLLKAALENQRRQQDRIRLFEHGARFAILEGETREIDSLAGVALGARLPEQWGIGREAREPVDFFDVKSDVEALLAGTGSSQSIAFESATPALSCLHPGRAARIMRAGRQIGWLGELHPGLVRELDFTYTPVLFELDVAGLAIERPQYHEISRFPQVRRDLAVVIDEATALSDLAERVTLVASSLLSELRIFDVYRGSGVEAGRKSVALGLIFQDISRTLTDSDVERLIGSIVSDLRVTLNARIRE